jgi:ABC-type lipoprotein release transport system permease subunit
VSRFLASYLFGVRGDDTLTLTLVVLFMVTVVAAAAFVPARRAVALSPTEALRIE